MIFKYVSWTVWKISAFYHDYKCVKNHAIINIDLEDIEGSWLKTWRTWVILDVVFDLQTCFLTCLPNLNFLPWLSVSRTILSSMLTWRTMMVPDSRHGSFWCSIWSSNMFPDLSAKFQFFTMIISVSRTILSSMVTWRTLRVPDSRHGGHESYLM